jgi:prepilin signal peptidase PulO-like enzyme (type II secretory pathway)
MSLKYFIKECLEFLSKIVITSVILLLYGFGSGIFLSVPIMLFDWIFSTEILNYLTERLPDELTLRLIVIGLLGIPLFVYNDASRFITSGEKD